MEVQAVNSSEKNIIVQVDGKEEYISPITLEILKETNILIERYGDIFGLITYIRNNKVCKKHIESKKIYLKLLRTVCFSMYGIKA